jgi:hypothetical protein
VADLEVFIRDAKTGELVPVDVRTTPNGDSRQVLLLGDGEAAGIISPATEGTLGEVASALQTGEDPLAGIDKGGVDVTGEDQELVSANPSRAKVDGMNATDGRVWLGFGESAEIGNGLFLEPGGYFGEFTTDAVHVLAEPGAVGRVTWQEWSA